MSNLLFNLRLWYWHFQIRRDRPWISFSRNPYRWARGERSPWIELHCPRLDPKTLKKEN